MINNHSPATGIKDRCQAIAQSRWFLPLLCLGLGLVILVVAWLGGQLGTGVYGLAVMAGFGLLMLLLTGRSETVRGLTVGRDERFAQIDLRATAVAGLALIITVIVAWLAEIARGRSGHP
jgi:Na+-translocating ferredoxin:NAD+ oxidoreductase RnfA subunit